MNSLTIETKNAKFQPKEIKLVNYFFEFATNQKNQPTFYYGKIKTAGINKGEKEYFKRYYYNSNEARETSAKEIISL